MAYDNDFTAVTGATFTAAQYNTYDRDNRTALFSKIEGLYYIGIIIETEVNTNPGTLLGFGTWVAHGTGRVTVGIDPTDTDFDTVGETGGAKTVALEEANNGPHTHTITIRKTNETQNVDSGAQVAAGAVNTTGTTSSSGSGTPHANVQPYIVVYRWKRTA